jgi:energy-coupling factor transporter ATP-binding protein EcfA2
MSNRIPWLPEHQKSVLELYLESDGNSGDLKDPRLLTLAANQKRSADSIGYKLGNFRFLDPVAEKRNLKGLDGISKADVSSWRRYSGRELSTRSIRKICEKGWAEEFGITIPDELEGMDLPLDLENEAMKNPVKPRNLSLVRLLQAMLGGESKTLALSLLAKPFTILTGASGTGKTKLAESLATYLSNSSQDNSAVIAVGADWTDNRNVLGFVNHLRTDEDSGRPTYQTTPVLDLLLRADKDSDTPYFLILDEMNLSHVERYFSDFLSVMEQENGQFDLHSEGPADDEEFTLPTSGDGSTGVPRKLAYPQNLFVIGTVNIDETTYMFSPKVLDRANVIEFKVKRDDLGAFLEKPGAYPETQPAASGVAERFLELAKKTRAHGLDPLPESVREPMAAHLLTLFDLLQNERFEFAYRTAKEITLFLQVSRELSEDQEPWDTGGWKKDLDTQILQKILPKLHGSIGRIAPLICALSHYGETGATSGAPNLRDLLKKPFEKEKASFPRSAQKLREMAGTLSVEQFVSFIS